MAQAQPRIRPIPIDRPTKRPARPRHNLPGELTRFIGREQEVAALSALLATTRLLTLTGSGGCGKTRLALAVAATQAARSTAVAYPDGIWLVEFAALTDPALVPQAVAAVFGVREEARRPLLDTLADAFSTRAPLLLLDNCEHVVVPVTAMADALLRACPRLRILATSREALRVPGEVSWRVPSLSLPDSALDQTAARIAESEAVQLFVDRVRLRQPTFALTDESAAAVAAICRRLDGMPLALELAATRANVLSLSQLEVRLDDALRLLTGGARTALPRHRTLRATLDWSFALLSDDERTVLQRLAVFAGGCCLAAAEAVCGGEDSAPQDVLSLLVQLVEKSLVQVEERNGEARYRLLETVRQYAAEHLTASGKEADARGAHVEWSLALAREAETALGGPEQRAWLERLAPELDNIRTALHWLLETRQAAHGLQISADFWRFWYLQDHEREGSRWLTAFLTLEREMRYAACAPATWMDALFAAGRLAIFRGEYGQARILLEEMASIAMRDASPHHTAFALMLLGHIALEQRDYPLAQTLYEEGILFARDAGDRFTRAMLIGSLGITLIMQEDTAAAHPLLDECLCLLHDLGDTSQVSRMLRWKGVIALLERDADRARAHLVEGLRLHQELHTLLGIAECLEVFAALHATAGQPARALHLVGAARTLRDRVAVPLPPYWHEWLNGRIAPVLRALGAAESAAALATGEAMTTDQAITAALGHAEPATSGERRAIKEKYGGLSARERAVVAEIARGKTNREIADALFVTEKTIEWHVSNSLRKLGFRARAELAVWAIAVDLVVSPHVAHKEAPSS